MTENRMMLMTISSVFVKMIGLLVLFVILAVLVFAMLNSQLSRATRMIQGVDSSPTRRRAIRFLAQSVVFEDPSSPSREMAQLRNVTSLLRRARR